MRIVGGAYRGRTLLEFKGQAVRPTSDMVRESLFNILQFKIAGKTFLDLFCGTGAVGIEAISRGAEHVTFNDVSRDSIALTKSNLQKVGIVDGYEITSYNGGEYFNYTDKKFDYIFIDPPYKSDLGEKALNGISKILADDGMAIYENEKPFTDEIDGLIIVDRRKYGRAHLTFFKKGE